MFSTSQFKPLCYLHVYPVTKPFSSSYSASSSTWPTSAKKFTKVLYNLVVTRLRGMCRAVSGAQYKLVGKLKEIEFTDYLKQPLVMWKRMNKKRHSYCKSNYQVKKCGSFRFRYNWGSSHVLPLPVEPIEPALSRFDPTTLFHYSSIVSTQEEHYNTTTAGAGGAPESSRYLSAYLYWLEENNVDEDGNCNSSKPKNNDSISTAAAIATEGMREDVDELAEVFIARCREKFRLEKEESYRMFQEMMARSL